MPGRQTHAQLAAVATVAQSTHRTPTLRDPGFRASPLAAPGPRPSVGYGLVPDGQHRPKGKTAMLPGKQAIASVALGDVYPTGPPTGEYKHTVTLLI